MKQLFLPLISVLFKVALFTVIRYHTSLPNLKILNDFGDEMDEMK